MNYDNSLEGCSDQDQDQDDRLSPQPGQQGRSVVGLLPNSGVERSFKQNLSIKTTRLQGLRNIPNLW